MIRHNFWKRFSLAQLTYEEWDAVCDGCGKCCLIKLQKNEQTVPTYTSLACKFLDTKTCKCTVYGSRKKERSDCLTLSPKILEQIGEWLPNSCSYRLLSEGKDLPSWHHLNSKECDSVHETGNSVQNLAISEVFVDEEDFTNFIILR